jgi:hypothetical protein
VKIEFGKLEINIQVSPSRPAKQTETEPETEPEAPSHQPSGIKSPQLLKPQPVSQRAQNPTRELSPNFETKHLSIGFYPEVAVNIAGTLEGAA